MSRVLSVMPVRPFPRPSAVAPPSRRRSLPLLAFGMLVAVVALPAADAQEGAGPAGTPGGRRYPIDVEAAPRPSAIATRTTTPPVIDGRLDDPAWALAAVLTDFVQQLPNTGAAATHRTEARLLYDSTTLYVAAVNWQKREDIRIAGLERDFNSGASDIFGLTFDTFLDRRNSFLFLVNPGGAVRDEQTFNDSRTVIEAWEGIARVRTTISDTAWTVEMAIPLTTLRFDGARSPQDWGLNLLRRVRAYNESSYWSPLDRQYRIHRMSRAGTLTGLQGLRQGRNLTIKPYTLGGHSTGAQVPPSAQGGRVDAGGDLKYGVTSQLTLDLTALTDFSQVEVDQEQVNLTRFSQFFPERREFFIENSGSFTFGDVQERNYRMGASTSDFSLFQSRRIGLTPDGRPIAIYGGGRMTGRVGDWEVGALDMQTEPTGGARPTPAENFGVLRARRNFAGRSDVGAIVLNRLATDGSGRYNLSGGVDANLRVGPYLVVNSYLAQSEATGTASDGWAGRLNVGWRDRFWNVSAMYKEVSDEFDPGVGFIRRRAMQHSYGTVGVHARPSWRGIQEVSPYAEVDYITDQSGSLESRAITGGLAVNFQPDGVFEIEVRDQFERLVDPFTISSGVVIPAGAYPWQEFSVGYTTPANGQLSGSVRVFGGEFYDGTRRGASVNGTWRPRYDTYVDLTYQRNDVALPAGRFNADVAGVRARYAWSTRLFGSAFVQYNAETGTLVTNARINLRYAPLSDVFLVFTDRHDMKQGRELERSVVLKVTRLFAF